MPNAQMVRIGDYCTIVKGKIGIKKATLGKYPLVTTGEERSSHNECHFDKPSVIIPLVSSTGHGHASLKRIHYQEGKYAVGSILCTVSSKDENVLDAKFLYHYLDVYKEKLFVSRMKGMANVTLSVDAIKEVKFPLLSIEKQLDLIRLFEKTTFYTGNISTGITHQQTLLKKLRQSILQDAISGKLTNKWRKENPDIEPASELLKRIKAKKERLVKEKKMKKQKLLPLIKEDEIPFELPDGWVYCHIDDLLALHDNSMRRGPFGSAITKDMFVPKGDKTYKIYEQKNAIQKNYNLGSYYICEKHYKKLQRFEVKPNDIIISCAGTIGETYILPKDIPKGIINQALLKIELNNDLIINEFFIWLFRALTQQQINKDAKGSAMKNIGSVNYIKESVIFPLPPYKEQIKIISDLKYFYSYCDQLESQVARSKQDSELLMQTVLKNAFEE